MGLLLSHKRKLRIFPDMVTSAAVGEGGPGGGGGRGDIQVFSRKSRFRLFQTLHKLEFNRVTFCTLTYPKEFPTDAKVYKAHLKEYRRRFEIWFGKVPAVWRLEFQRRGAPHFHIMYLDAPFIPLETWCELWSDVIHTDNPIHRKIGVDVKLVTGGKEGKLVAAYLAKYVAKVDDRLTECVKTKPGRWWGKWNITESPPVEIECLDYQAEQVIAALLDARKAPGWTPEDYTVCTIMGESMGTAEFRSKAIKTVLEVLKAKGDV